MDNPLVVRAERELDILLKLNEDKNDAPVIEYYRVELLALVKRFAEYGHSGGSAPMVAMAVSHALKKLCLQEPIAPLTGLPDEFMEVADGVHQNIRDSRVFKSKELEMKPYFLDAVIWHNVMNGQRTHGKAQYQNDVYQSRAIIKSFPFMPVTFYVKCAEIPVDPKDPEKGIKRLVMVPEQLDKAREFYDLIVYNEPSLN